MRLIIRCLLLLFSASVVFAQAPLPAGRVPRSASGPKNQAYFGYVRTTNDWAQSSSYSFNGFEVAYNRYFTKRIALVGEFDMNKNGDHKASYYGYRGGARYDFMTGRLRPFGQFTAGRAHFTGEVGTPVIKAKFWGLSWAGTGGADYRLTKRWGIRGQWSLVRVPFGINEKQRDFWFQWGGGATFRW